MVVSEKKSALVVTTDKKYITIPGQSLKYMSEKWKNILRQMQFQQTEF